MCIAHACTARSPRQRHSLRRGVYAKGPFKAYLLPSAPLWGGRLTEVMYKSYHSFHKLSTFLSHIFDFLRARSRLALM